MTAVTQAVKRRPAFWYCETWKMNFHFCIGWPDANFQKYLKKQYDYETETKCVDAKTLKIENDKGTAMLIWVRDRKNFPAIAHESAHAANWTLSVRGWKPDLDNDEPQAYLVESIFRKATA